MRYIYFIAILFFYSCNPNQTNETPGTSTTTVEEGIARTDTVYIVRNADITPANSYSDLFMDSSAMQQFMQDKKLSDDESKSFRSFYNYRNLQFAWFTSEGLTEEAKSFWSLQDKLSNTSADKMLRNQMDELLNNDSLVVSRYDTAILNTELSITKAYLRFYSTNRNKTLFANTSAEKAIPVKKENTLALADTILSRNNDSSSTNTAASQYFKLKQKLQLFTAAAKQGGWPVIPSTAKQIKKGSPSATVALIKKRLQLSGDYLNVDTSNNFNDSLLSAIKIYQQHNGIKPSGLITDTLIRSLNIPVEKRIQQIIINLNRMKWMPVTEEANYITVNIPDFMLYAFENNAQVFTMPVVVGKEGTNTTMFSGNLDQIVFSPYWNIPVSIVKNEILPKMKSDPNYLKSKNMEIVGKNDSLPTIRQLPGADNALGKVKFLFPNRYDIYFHDTNAKDIFKKDLRAASHGCIRLADAEKMATYLLRNKAEWTPEKINAAMNSGKEQYVKLKQGMPVNITYFTTWVDENGQLNFRDDVYGNDKKIMQMMFNNSVPVATTNIKDSVLKKK